MHKKYQTVFSDKQIYEGMQELTVVGWFKQRSLYMKTNLNRGMTGMLGLVNDTNASIVQSRRIQHAMGYFCPKPVASLRFSTKIKHLRRILYHAKLCISSSSSSASGYGNIQGAAVCVCVCVCGCARAFLPLSFLPKTKFVRTVMMRFLQHPALATEDTP